MITKFAAVVCSVFLSSSSLMAQPSIRKEAIRFAKGESGATIKGQIKSDQIVDYTLTASAGQSMVVVFTPSNKSAYFNLTAPKADEAMFVGSTSGNKFKGELPASGVYTIRVYLMRNAARRNESASYTLDVVIAGAANKPGGTTPNAALPSKSDASGDVRCSAGQWPSGTKSSSNLESRILDTRDFVNVTIWKESGRS